MKDKTVIDIGEPYHQDSENQEDPSQASWRLSDFARFIAQPLSSKGWPRWAVFTLAIIGVVYILNPTFGFFELLPDNLPIIGNLDEGVAFMLVLAGLVELFDKKPKK